MRIVDLTCPNCGAPLSANGDRQYIFCTYCGKQIYLDDTVKVRFTNAYEAGRDFERGRQSAAQHGPNMELAGKLRQARYRVAKREELEQEISNAQGLLVAARNTKIDIAGVGFAVLVVVLLSLLVNPVLGGLCLCGGIAILVAVYNGKKKKKEAAVAEKQQRLSELVKQKDQIPRSSLGISLSEKYMTVTALDSLYEFIVNERAYTLQQAINLYEDRAHQLKMERLAREQLDAQKRQIDLLEQQQRENEENDSGSGGSGLGKALLIGGLAVAAISLFRRRD